MRKRRLYISLLSIILGLTSCAPLEVDRNDVLVLGHGGAGFLNLNSAFPPNSEASIKQVLLMQSADGTEVDVQLTADNHLVLFHDNRLETATHDTGYISGRTLSELKAIQYRSSANLGNDYAIWPLKELLDFISEEKLQVWLSLNVHPQYEVADQEDYNARLANAFVSVLNDYPLREKVVIESPEIENLRALRKNRPQGVQLYYTQPITPENLLLVESDSLDGFVANYLQETESSMAKAREKNLGVALYGIKIRMDIRPALNLKPDFVQVDNVPLTLSYLE